MKVLTVNYPKQAEDEAKIKYLLDHYDSKLAAQVLSNPKAISLPEPNVQIAESEKASLYEQFKLLMWRNKMGLKRNPGHGRIKVSQTLFMALLCLALFHDQYDYSEARSLIGGLFFVSVNQTMMNMMGTLLTFQQERPVFLREQANKMYTVGAYYLSKISAETPILALTPMLFSIVVYFKIGLTITASQFFYFYLIILLLAQCAASFGYFMSCIFHKEEMAV